MRFFPFSISSSSTKADLLHLVHSIALTSATVQGFFGFSLFKVAKSSLQINSYLLAAVIAVTPIAAFVVNIITCIRIWETPMLRNLINHKTTTLTIFALDLVADTFLSCVAFTPLHPLGAIR